MEKVHVTDDGRVLPCSAQVNCIYSNAEDGNRHFFNMEEAQAKASNLLKSRYELFTTRRKKIELPIRVKNNEIPGSLVMKLDAKNLQEDRFALAENNTTDNENFDDFKKECEESLFNV